MSLEFTLVRRAISLAVIDGPDTDDNPDILQAQGSVLFEPVIKKGDSIQVQTRDGAETYALAPIECPINDGIISHRGQDGVKLPAGGEDANPSLIRWKATFSRMQAGGKSFTLAPVIFDAVPGGEIDLTMVAPVAGTPEGIVRGPRGTSLESIIVEGSELVFTAVDDAGSFEIARIPLDEMVRAEAEAAADGVRDELAVDVAAAQSARDAAEGHADRAATSESNAAASESAAKQSETNAGDYAAVATTAATEAVDAMETASDAASSIGDSASEAAGHADRASQSESGAAAYAQNASDAADRVGTAEQVGTWASEASASAAAAATSESNAGGHAQAADGHANRAESAANSASDSASAAAQSETKAKEYRDAAFSAASSTADELRGELIDIAGEASSHATESSRSAARAKASETNAATHEANSLSAAERAEFAAEETIQQVEGDFATRNYVDQRVPITGAGSPEGNVAAPVGTVYTDSEATNGAIRWIKTSGTGSTGWVVEYGDTGLRNITSLIAGITAGKVLYQRKNGRITLTFEQVQGSGAHTFQIPSSRPKAELRMHLFSGSSTATPTLQFVARPRTAHGIFFVDGQKVDGEISWDSNDGWPTTSPGTPT